MSGAYLSASSGGHVWLDTPRGVLGGCFRCGSKKMRACQCFQDAVTNQHISEHCDAFAEHRQYRAGSRRESALSRLSMRSETPEGSGVRMTPDKLGEDETSRVHALLEQLKRWKDEGLIDEAEYKQEKANALKMLIPGPGNARPSSSLGYTSTYSSHYVEKKPLHDLAGSKMVGEEDVEYEAGSNVPKARIDYLFNQLRQICYRKVKGNGSDVSVREIFRHFDNNKNGSSPGIDMDEFSDAVKRLMLGSHEGGIISEEEARLLFNRIDSDGSGSIDYREIASTLSLPGWDIRFLNKKSNILL